VHLISDIHQPEAHIERSAQSSGILRLNFEDKDVAAFYMACCRGPGIYLIGELRLDSRENPFSIVRPEPEDCFCIRHGMNHGNYAQKTMINIGEPILPVTEKSRLSGLKFLDCCAALFEEDPVSTVGAPYVDVDLNFLFAPCTLV